MWLLTLFLDWHPSVILPNFKCKQGMPKSSDRKKDALVLYNLSLMTVSKGRGRVFGEGQGHCGGREQ